MLNKRELEYWCVVKDRKLYLVNHTLPLMTKSELGFNSDDARWIGEYSGHPVFWLEADDNTRDDDFYTHRELLGIDGELFDLAGKATQLSHMKQSETYCPNCGGQCQLAAEQLAMECQQCQRIHYPRVSPCVIVAVRKQDKVLLAQHPRHKTGMYTVIAGFVEAGETLEQCVAREVLYDKSTAVIKIAELLGGLWSWARIFIILPRPIRDRIYDFIAHNRYRFLRG